MIDLHLTLRIQLVQKEVLLYPQNFTHIPLLEFKLFIGNSVDCLFHFSEFSYYFSHFSVLSNYWSSAVELVGQDVFKLFTFSYLLFRFYQELFEFCHRGDDRAIQVS